MMLMAELSQACWERSSLSIIRLLQAVLLSDFNYKLVAILTSVGTHKQACSYMPIVNRE